MTGSAPGSMPFGTDPGADLVVAQDQLRWGVCPAPGSQAIVTAEPRVTRESCVTVA